LAGFASATYSTHGRRLLQKSDQAINIQVGMVYDKGLQLRKALQTARKLVLAARLPR
jgi:hypothetical protein